MQKTIKPIAEVAAILGRTLTQHEIKLCRASMRCGMMNPFDIINSNKLGA